MCVNHSLDKCECIVKDNIENWSCRKWQQRDVGLIFFGALPWPCAAVAAARAGAADRGSLQRPGPPEVSGSHSTLCRGPPCNCGESAGNHLYPAGRGGEKYGFVSSRVKGEERRLYGEQYFVIVPYVCRVQCSIEYPCLSIIPSPPANWGNSQISLSCQKKRIRIQLWP